MNEDEFFRSDVPFQKRAVVAATTKTVESTQQKPQVERVIFAFAAAGFAAASLFASAPAASVDGTENRHGDRVRRHLQQAQARLGRRDQRLAVRWLW